MKTFDVVTVGHFTVDRIFSPRFDNPVRALGGSPAYVSLAARKLNARAGAISKVGSDFLKIYTNLLHNEGVDLFGVKIAQNAHTTSFILKYANGKRQLRLKNRAPHIFPRDLPTGFKAKIAHVAPIAGEISSEVVDELRKNATILSLDPQGFLRKFDAKGRVGLKKWLDKRVLEQIDVYKSSLPEIRAATGLTSLKDAMRKVRDFGVKIVIVTRGTRGAVVLFEEKFCRIPAYKPQKLMDSTGAGDAFAGAFLAEYINEKDPIWCACIGSAVAAFKVETVGPVFLGEKEAIYRRAEALYGKYMQTETHNGL